MVVGTIKALTVSSMQGLSECRTIFWATSVRAFGLMAAVVSSVKLTASGALSATQPHAVSEILALDSEDNFMVAIFQY